MPKKPARKPRKPIPAPLQRCVTAVAPKMKAQGRGVGAAFAICTSQLQKSGVLKKGTRTVTHKGAGVISGIARRGEYRSTMREFEKVVSRENGAVSGGLVALRTNYGDWAMYEYDARSFQYRGNSGKAPPRRARRNLRGVPVASSIRLDFERRGMRRWGTVKFGV